MLCIAFSNIAFGEFYISRADGNWNDLSTWQLSSGVATRLPNTQEGVIDEIVILHNVLLDGEGPYTQPGKLSLDNGGNLTITRQFIFSGSELNINSSSTLEITNPDIDEIFIIQPGSVVRPWESGARIIVDNANANTSIVNNGNLRIIFGLLYTSSTIINASQVLINPNGQIVTETDYIALDNSFTNIQYGDLRIGDDLTIYGTDLAICGQRGRIIMGMAEDNVVEYINGQQIPDQICFNITEDANPTPVEILSFRVENNTLVWEVYEERITGYEIEISEDAENWAAIGALESRGDGNHTYNFTVHKSGYYRLKVVSIEEAEYSSILFYNGSNEVSFYPSIIRSGKSITFTGEKLIDQVELLNYNGIALQKGKLLNGKFTVNQVPGIYIVKIQSKNLYKTGKLVVE